MCWPFSDLELEDPEAFVVPVAINRQYKEKHKRKSKSRRKTSHRSKKMQKKETKQAWYLRILPFKSTITKIHIHPSLNKMTKMWHDETKQPFENEAATYTYIPRISSAPTSPETASAVYGAQPCCYAHQAYHPSYASLAYYQQPHQCHCYAGGYHSYITQPKYVEPANPHYSYYPTGAQSGFSYYYDAHAQPAYPQYVKHGDVYDPYGAVTYEKKPLKDGSLPYFGRTAQEVQYDAWQERKYYERELKRADKEKAKAKAKAERAAKEDAKSEKSDAKTEKTAKSEAKSVEPKGKPTGQYWVVHKDGGMRAYPLGTIKNNFEGEWKIDQNGWPYLAEK